MTEPLLPDLDEMRRDALISGLGMLYLPSYEGEIGTFDHLKPYAPAKYMLDLIELALDAYYREEAG